MLFRSKDKRPSYKYLRVWGCLAKVAVPTPKKMKIGPKMVDYIFIGYAHNDNAYKFLVYESEGPLWKKDLCGKK